MPVLLQYRKSDGYIVGGWESNTLALLYAQIPDGDEMHGYHTDLSGQSLDALREGHYVEGFALVPKRQLVITAVPNPFSAQADTVCHVSVAPFEPCTLLVDGIPYALAEEDRTLELSSDEPHFFTITLAAMAQTRAGPVTIEAR